MLIEKENKEFFSLFRFPDCYHWNLFYYDIKYEGKHRRKY